MSFKLFFGNPSTAVGNTVALTGVSSASAVGTVGIEADVTIALTGLAATSGVGIVGFAKGGSLTISGEEATSNIGSVGVSVGGSVTLSGVGATADVGSVAISTTISLSGVGSTADVGSVSVGGAVTVATTGVEGTSGVGSVAFTKSGTLVITGVEGTTGVGTVIGSVPGTGGTYSLIVGNQMITTLADTKFPVDLAVDDSGGVTGLGVTISLRDPEDNTSYLDFSDNTFKTSGWTTKTKSLTEFGGGFYGTLLDVSAITNFPSANHALIEYSVVGSVTAISTSLLTIAQTWENPKALTVGKFLGLK